MDDVDLWETLKKQAKRKGKAKLIAQSRLPESIGLSHLLEELLNKCSIFVLSASSQQRASSASVHDFTLPKEPANEDSSDSMDQPSISKGPSSGAAAIQETPPRFSGTRYIEQETERARANLNILGSSVTANGASGWYYAASNRISTQLTPCVLRFSEDSLTIYAQSPLKTKLDQVDVRDMLITPQRVRCRAQTHRPEDYERESRSDPRDESEKHDPIPSPKVEGCGNIPRDQQVRTIFNESRRRSCIALSEIISDRIEHSLDQDCKQGLIVMCDDNAKARRLVQDLTLVWVDVHRSKPSKR